MDFGDYAPRATDLERATQDRVIDFFQKFLKYKYIGNLIDQENKNIIEDRLRLYLNNHYKSPLVEKAITKLKDAAFSSFDLSHANKEFYSLLIYGVKVLDNDTNQNVTVYPIDFDKVYNNDFAIAEEVTVKENENKRPDLVVYVNGIALGVIELKKNTVSIDDAIKQNITNQHADFINHFFNTVQICVAGKDAEGIKYGTTNTSFKFYVPWKEDYFPKNEESDPIDSVIENLFKTYTINNKLLKDFCHLFHPERLLDIIHNFIIFDNGVKKICRYNQYYAVKRSIKRLEKDSGIIWHTQGSGKTLTMVWLARWISENIKDSRVLIVTDREELETQMNKNFSETGNYIVKAKSGSNLIEKINTKETTSDNRLVLTLVHKFRINPGEDYDKTLGAFNNELEKLAKSISYHHDKYYIFVDECHRTQSGKFHEVMKKLVPLAKFIGFTGTPLLDKNDSRFKFGQYIHTYKCKQGEEDGVVTPMKFIGYNIEQEIINQSGLDTWFDEQTKSLNKNAKAQLKEKWAKIDTIYSSKSRLDKIVRQIMMDFNSRPELKFSHNGGHAILVSDSIFNAGRYWEIFQQYGFDKCAVITSYEPSTRDLVNQLQGGGEENNIVKQHEIFTKILNGKTLDEYEKEKKDAFTKGFDSVKLLIVVDKLLTGFDAPPCSVIYIDKKMENHGLFQAICRTNRIYRDKDHGLVVDFKELVDKLEDAYKKYNSDEFIPELPEEPKGLIENAEALIGVFLSYYNALLSYIEDVPDPKEINEFNLFFAGESNNIKTSDEDISIREHLYTLINKSIKSFCNAKYYMKDKYTNEELSNFENKLKFFYDIATTLQQYAGDRIDLTNFDHELRNMMDLYIESFNPVELVTIENFTEFCEKIAKTYGDTTKFSKGLSAEIIVSNVQKKIMQLLSSNPKFYGSLSEALNALIEKNKNNMIKYEEYIKELINIANSITTVSSKSYPAPIEALGDMAKFGKALYDNIDDIISVSDKEAYIVDLCNKINRVKESNWQYEAPKQNNIKKVIFSIVNDFDTTNKIFDLMLNQEGI